ncbi:MAG: response regulator transcription factor [Pleurocapsa minor GSE-CHR-MK-17-07R]|jgi:two-component system KDP operon response regulator KdpE|nr:response regulator transcription factor [Pleurocapsa minor GSE-CHR-MK 17-07R]
MVSSSDNSRSVLMVVSDPETSETVSALVSPIGYSAQTVQSLDPDETASAPAHDVLLVDIGKSTDAEASEKLRQVRATTDAPVIAINARSAQAAVAALNAGADEVVDSDRLRTELVPRMNALIRRIERTPPAEDRLVIRGIELHLTRRLVMMRGQRLHLTPIEYDILVTLMRNAGHTVTHDDLLGAVWGSGYAGDYSVLRVNISRLRQKLEDNPRNPSYIVTVAGEGYVMPTASR